MNFKRSILLVVIVLAAFLSSGCSTAVLRHPGDAIDYVFSRKVVATDRTKCPYDRGGVHHIRDMERVVTAGTVLTDIGGRPVLLPLWAMCEPDSVRAQHVLSSHVERDMHGNYLVYFRGEYPVSLVPGYAFGRKLGPKVVVNHDAVDQEAFLFVPGSGNPGIRLAIFEVRGCGWQRILLPAGDANGVDFRWRGSGGANDATYVPNIGAGVVPGIDGFLVLNGRRGEFTIAGTGGVPQCQVLNIN